MARWTPFEQIVQTRCHRRPQSLDKESLVEAWSMLLALENPKIAVLHWVIKKTHPVGWTFATVGSMFPFSTSSGGNLAEREPTQRLAISEGAGLTLLEDA